MEKIVKFVANSKGLPSHELPTSRLFNIIRIAKLFGASKIYCHLQDLPTHLLPYSRADCIKIFSLSMNVKRETVLNHIKYAVLINYRSQTKSPTIA